MTADTIRLAGTFGLAFVVLVGLFVILVFPSQVPPEQILPFATGIVGSILGWAFNRESTTAGQRSSERAVALGANTAGPTPLPGTTTTTSTTTPLTSPGA
jgi:hypothetical protein